MRRPLLPLLALPLLLAFDAPPLDRLAKLVARHDAAVQTAADVYWKQKLAADKSFADAVKTESKAERDGAAADIAADEAALKAHTPLTTMAEARKEIHAAELPPTVAKAIDEHRLMVGMTVDDADDALRCHGKQTAADAKGQVYEWTLSHPAPYQGGGLVRGEDAGDARAELGMARAHANDPRPTIIDAVWSGRFEGGKLVSFKQTQ